MTQFEINAVIHKINSMFSGRIYSICDVRRCADVTGANQSSRLCNALSLYHCCSFSEMSKETKQDLFKNTVEFLCNKDFPELQLKEQAGQIRGLI